MLETEVNELLSLLDDLGCEMATDPYEKPIAFTIPPNVVAEECVILQDPVWPGTMKRKKGGYRKYQ